MPSMVKADAGRVKAADRQCAAGAAIGFIVLEADARHGVDRVEDRLSWALTSNIFLSEDRFRLGRVGGDDATHLLLASGRDDNGLAFLFELLRTGRLGKCGGREKDSRRAKKNKLFHVLDPPRVSVRKSNRAAGL
jgi:hypothetical protein